MISIYEQLPLSSRRHLSPVKGIYWALVMPHEHAARALVKLMQIGKTPSGTAPRFHHAPEAFNGIEVVPAPGWQSMQPKLLMPVCQRGRELVRSVDTTVVGAHDNLLCSSLNL
jgi:hypothetical protein